MKDFNTCENHSQVQEAQLLDLAPVARVRAACLCGRSGCECAKEGGLVHCPAHSDNTPSLSVSEGGGKALVKCFAGCAQEAVVDALKARGAWPSTESGPAPARRSRPPAKPKAAPQLAHGDGLKSRAPEAKPKLPKAPFTWAKATVYGYKDESGALLFEVGRCDAPGCEKSISQRRPEPSAAGGWVYKLAPDTPRVLWRLRDVLEAATVYVCEGEKAAERLNEALCDAGLYGAHVATTAPQGAGKWRPEYSQVLAGRAVVVLPDNDAPGAAHGAQVCAATFGLASSLRLLSLPELAEHGDVCDFLEAGGTLEQLREQAEAAPEWKRPEAQEAQLTEAERAPGAEGTPQAPEGAPRARFKLRPLAEVEAQPQLPALIEGVAPAGVLFGLVGPWGSGKSFIALDWAMCVATGRSWHGRAVQAGAVVYITPEGTRAFGKRTRAWRIVYGQECPANFHLITEAPQVMHPEDVGELLQVLAELPERPALVVVDTVARHMVGGDENSQRDMGLFVAGADRIQAATGAAVLLVHHTGKDGKMRGSTVLPGALEAYAEVQKVGERGARLTCGKAKDEAEFEPIGLEGRVVELPELDIATGRPLTSLVFALDTRAAAPPEPGKDAKLLLSLLPEGGASYSEWKAAAEGKGIASATFDRLRRSVVGKQVTQDTATGRYSLSLSASYQNAITIPGPQVLSQLSHPFRGDSCDSDSGSRAEAEGTKATGKPKRKAKALNGAQPTYGLD